MGLKWAEDFPVEAARETEVSRRDFIRFIFLVSLGLFTGTFGVLLRGLLKRGEKALEVAQVKIMDKEAIGVGGSYVFKIPDTEEPAILVRLARDRYVAYSQKCTHLQCPVLWKKEENKLLCPCHHGAFAVESGKVLYGPPERSLPEVRLAVREEGIYFAGVKR